MTRCAGAVRLDGARGGRVQQHHAHRDRRAGWEGQSFFTNGKAGKALILVMGTEGTYGGTLNKKAFHMAEYLHKAGY
ncbi:hypothetical protein AOLI_G00147840 [Acnodon oligacanthus]